MTRNIKAVVEYDGTDYRGWQEQPVGKTIEGEIIKALKNVTGETIKTYGSGRTDAGVHSYGQTFSFKVECSIPCENLLFALNGRLADAINIVSLEEVDMDFHARYNANGKIYTYKINNGAFDPFISRFYHHHSKHLDIAKMEEASMAMIGKKDFKSFMASGAEVKDTIREVYSINFRKKNDTIEIDFHGSGFLYNMVRIMASLLLQAGEGRVDYERINAIILAQNRQKARHTAPANGLFLKKVLY